MTTPDPMVQQRIEECQGMVRSLALSISRKLPRSVELDDLIAYGQVGWGEAARGPRSNRGGDVLSRLCEIVRIVRRHDPARNILRHH